MKRNILLLTAVVLAAVMLTGCIGPFAKVKVAYEFGKLSEATDAASVSTHFKEKELVKKVKKSSKVDFEFIFAGAEGVTYDSANYKVTIKSGKDTSVFEATDFKAVKKGTPEAIVGFSVEYPVLKDKIEIKVEYVGA